MDILRNLDESKEAFSRQKQTIANLKRSNTQIKNRLKAVEHIDKLCAIPIIVEKADELGMPPEEFITNRLTESIEQEQAQVKMMPVQPAFYEQFSKLARARGLSPDELSMRPNVFKWLMRGLSNSMY